MTKHSPPLSALMLNLIYLARTYLSASDKMLAKCGVSYAVAMPVQIIHRMGDGIKTGALAKAIYLEPSSVVRVVDQLINNGMLERRNDPKDRRVRLLFLTEKGKQLAQDTELVMVPFRRELAKYIPEQDLGITMHIVHQLLETLADYRS